VGAVVFDVAAPSSPTAAAFFAVSIALALLVSFGIRYLVALSSFWLTDVRGVQAVASLVSLFFSGAVLPLAIFPGAFGTVARALPWAATVQAPMTVYLSPAAGPAPLGVLAFQACWAALLLAAGRAVTAAAVRRVVVQGG
jgi:ABC-2 type transport system permease protein